MNTRTISGHIEDLHMAGGVAQLCTQVTDIFRTMQKIASGEIEVY